MFDDVQRIATRTYLIEAVRAVAFFGCFGLILFALYVFGPLTTGQAPP